MPCFTQALVLLTTLGAVAASSNPIIQREAPIENGPLSIYAARLRHGAPIPPELSAAVKRAGFDTETLVKRRQKQQHQQQHQNGSVSATPSRNNTEWVTRIEVGTPPQVLHVQLDTGSAEFWVFADAHPTAKAASHGVYSPSLSSTASRIAGMSWNKTYAGGDGASGDAVYNDVVRVGGVVARAQAVLPATAASDSLVKAPYDGIMGLSLVNYTATLPASAKGPSNFFETVKSSLPAPLYGVDLRQDAEGWFDFGVVPPNRHRGEVAWAPVHRVPINGQDFTRWNMTASGYAVGDGSSLTARNMTGVVDTGTTLLYLDKPIVEAYYGRVTGARYDANSSGWVFPCDGSQPLPNFSFGVGPVGNATVITVPGRYLNWTVNDDTKRECFGGLQESFDYQGGKLSLFGAVAMKSAYVIFEDPRPAADPRIGWAAKDL